MPYAADGTYRCQHGRTMQQGCPICTAKAHADRDADLDAQRPTHYQDAVCEGCGQHFNAAGRRSPFCWSCIKRALKGIPNPPDNPQEPESLQWDMIMQRPTDADIPDDIPTAAIATAPVEPEELALEWTLHQWTDADIPADDDAPVGAQPRPCGHGLTAGPHETVCPWCVAEAEVDERRSFYPF